MSGGALLVTGTLATSGRNVIVAGGTFLGGTGTINRPVDVFTGGHLAPGTSTGVLRTGALTFAVGSALDIEITSVAAGQFDQINITGTVEIAESNEGVALNISKAGTVNLQDGDQLVIISNDGSDDAVDGTFKNLPEGAIFAANFLGTGLTATISYQGISGNDNDVVIKLSPSSQFPWHNEARPLDVSGGDNNQPDDSVDAGDALSIINYLNSFGPGPVPEDAVLGLPFGFLDTDGDNNVSSGDALNVINAINSGLEGEGEGGQWSVVSCRTSCWRCWRWMRWSWRGGEGAGSAVWDGYSIY